MFPPEPLQPEPEYRGARHLEPQLHARRASSGPSSPPPLD
jgi:hypothetical protein